jgi:hypothetical protein
MMFPVREKKVSDTSGPVLEAQPIECVCGWVCGRSRQSKVPKRVYEQRCTVASRGAARSSSQDAARYWRRRHGSGPEWTSDPSIPRPSASTTSSRLPVHTTHKAACIGSNREVRIRVSHEVDEISRRQAREPPEFPSSATD